MDGIGDESAGRGLHLLRRFAYCLRRTQGGGMDVETRKIPTHEATYAQLRDMVLFGQLAPGQAITIQGLIGDLDAGMTPVREAIRRLTAEGALVLQGNRRVVVPKLTEALLDQLEFARCTIEPKLAELAAARLTPALIDRLAQIDAAIEPAIYAGDITGYLRWNHAFHFMLYEASEATVLVDMARSLWLRFGPSLRVVCAHYRSAELTDRHHEALDAMRRGDAAALAAAFASDIAQGVDQVRAGLRAGEF